MRQGLIPRRAFSIATCLTAVTILVILFGTTAVGQDAAGIEASGEPGVMVSRDYAFRNRRLRDDIDYLAHSIKLNVVYHVSSLELADSSNIDLALKHVSAPGAIDVLLRDYGLSHIQIDRRAIMIVKQGQRDETHTSVHSLVAKAETEEAQERRHETAEETPERIHGTKAEGSHLHDVVFKQLTLAGGLQSLAGAAHLRVLFDPTVEASAKTSMLTVSLNDVSIPQALRYILDAYDLKYVEIDGHTLNIVDEHHDHSSTPLEEIIRKLH